MTIRIDGGRALIDGRLASASVHVDSGSGTIRAIDSDEGAEQRIDASGLLVLPGIVDIHGDAFERQMMPRPGVGFPLDVALLESDRQAVANGITTVFHGVTWSWEPRLRGAETAGSGERARDPAQPRGAAAAALRRHALPPSARDPQSRRRAGDHRLA